MQKIYVKDYGILPDSAECCWEKLDKFFADLGDDCEVIFEKGNYKVYHELKIQNKKNLTVNGNGANFEAYYDPTSWNDHSRGLFYFSNCPNLKVEHMSFTTSRRTSTAGKVIWKDDEKGVYELELLGDCHLNGDEILMTQNSLDEDYSPDYKLVTYGPANYEIVRDKVIKVTMGEQEIPQVAAIDIGQVIVYRHTMYGAHHLTIYGCDDAHVDDIRTYEAPGMVSAAGGRGKNITYSNYTIKPPEGKEYLLGANADGIHIYGVLGKFTLRDSYWAQLGDDALNVHSMASIITEVNTEEKYIEGKFFVHARIADTLPDDWCEDGDRILTYDTDTYFEAAKFKIKKRVGDRLYYEDLEGELKVGDKLINEEFFTEVHIDNCTVKNTRARAFLLRTRNVTIENCKIFGMAMAAFLFSFDVIRWGEVGASRNVVIRNNTIEKCNIIKSPFNYAAINVRVNDEGAGFGDSLPGVHNNFLIENNKIINCGASAIAATAIKNIKIVNNEFINNGNPNSLVDLETKEYDIVLHHCEGIEIDGNKTDKAEDKKVLLL